MHLYDLKTVNHCKNFTELFSNVSLIVRPSPLQSFLSCSLNGVNKKPTSKKIYLNDKQSLALSCPESNTQKTQSDFPLSYRADNTQSSLILGIDPGITGAMAIISSGENPKFVAVFDFPTLEVKIGNKLKTRIDLESLSFLIESYSKDILVALIEEVGQISTKSDPFSSFVFGFATGSVHGVLTSNQIKIETVKPLIWKAALGLDSDKSKSIAKAIKLFPEAEIHLKRKKDHGRAEAILLAHFAWKLGARK